MKHAAILTLLAALLSFGAAGIASADDCSCKKTTAPTSTKTMSTYSPGPTDFSP
ncbi:MAG: hypothetical protein HZB55_12000 [Deltaproteobacteria bacterium]|nr:hypothetical protein [Deltaproteobacteria bacterium]